MERLLVFTALGVMLAGPAMLAGLSLLHELVHR